MRGQVDQLQGLGRAMSTEPTACRRPSAARVRRDLRHDAARRRPVRGHLAHRRGQAARRRAARLARRRAGSRAATRRPTRRTRSSSGARRTELHAVRPPTLRGVRLDPAARRQGRRRPHARRRWSSAGTSTVCIVGKSWDFHVTEALRTTLDEGVAMVGESVEFLKAAGLRVFFDAEHFFDGYKANPEYALRVLEAAATNGADCARAVRHQRRLAAPRGAAHHRRGRRPTSAATPIGIHTQNDAGCAVANSVAAVLGGATQRAGHGQRLRRAHRQRQPHDGASPTSR